MTGKFSGSTAGLLSLGCREFTIGGDGMTIGEPFRGADGIIGGVPTGR